MAAPLEKTDVPGVYKRGSRYVYSYRHRGKQKWGSAATKAAARREKHAAETDVARGEHRDGRTVTFSAYALEWLETYQGRTARGLDAGTREGYRQCVTARAIPLLGNKRMTDIGPRDIRQLVQTLTDSGLAPGSVRKYVAPLKALFATAVEDELIKSNPAASVRIATVRDDEDDEPANAMTPDELARLLAEIPDDRREFFEFLAKTGLRISEAIGLRVGDVSRSDEGRPCVRVRQQLYRGQRKRLKTRDGRRDVPLTPDLARRLWHRQGDDNAPLFPAARGGHLNERALRRDVLDPAAARAGVPWVTFHTFRHTCASLLFASGKNAKQVAGWLGHSDPAFTLRTYIHLLDGGLGDADALDELVPVPGVRTQVQTSAAIGRVRASRAT
jgi:integrase